MISNEHGFNLAKTSFSGASKGAENNFTPNLGPANLVLNDQGGIYHLGLRPEQLADKVLVFGDPARACDLAHAIGIDIESPTTLVTGKKEKNRSLVTITGDVDSGGTKHRVSLVTHGMGTSSEIIFKELRALRDISFITRTQIAREEIEPLKVVRVGTCGSITGDNLGSIVLTNVACDFTGVSAGTVSAFTEKELMLLIEMREYLQTQRLIAARERGENPLTIAHLQPRPYEVDPDILISIESLANQMNISIIQGMTASAPGFFDTQGRDLFAKSEHDLAFGKPMDQVLREFEGPDGEKFANFEMESGILQSVFRDSVHQTATICVAVANRVDNTFSPHVQTEVAMEKAAQLACAWVCE